MSALLDWLAHDSGCSLTQEQQHDVLNHIGYLCSMAKSVSDVLGEGIIDECDASNLSFTVSLLIELSGKLNGLLQTPPDIG